MRLPSSGVASFLGQAMRRGPLLNGFTRRGHSSHKTTLLAASGAAAVMSALSALSAQHAECLGDHERESSVFASKGDPYKGVSVAAKDVAECVDAGHFREMLTTSLAAWRERGRKGVWIEIPSTRPELIAIAQAHGFTYHHAEPGYLMMCTWLGEGDSMLPANASHSIGVGIVCVNERDELVMVQEATGPAANRPGGFWKVPTGLVNAGEELAAGCVREMKEETGIDVEHVATVGFREMPRAMQGKGNLFFMCVCRLVGSAEIVIQAEELAAAQWMSIDEVMALPYYQSVGAYGELMRETLAAARSETSGLQRRRLPVSHDPKRGEATIYVPRARL